MRSTAGRVLEEVVADIYLMGAKPVGEYESERVDNTIKDLQIDRCVWWWGYHTPCACKADNG